MNKTFKGNVEITKDNVLEWEKKLKNVEAVMGNLYIYSNADLKALKSVGGYLYINSNVTLNNLKSVGGNLYIYSNADLKAPNLKSVGGNLYIYSNADLKAPNLKSVGGNLDINSNADLKAPNLKSVGGNLYINSNADLKALKSVGGYLYINSNVTLNNLKSVGGNLYIYSKIDPTLARRLIAQYSTKKSWYLSNETNESILSANLKTATYKIRGVEFKKELFDKVRKDKLSAEEVFALENLEQRRIAFELMDKVKMKALDNYKILDTVVIQSLH